MYKINKTILAALGGALLLTAGVVQAQNAPAASTAMPSTPAVSASTAAVPTPAVTAKVAHAQFTTAVSNREPADEVTTLDSSHNKVFFFTALADAAGQTITHRWEFNGKTMAEVKFEPKANHWRVWSSKTLTPNQTGTWSVDVVDGSGKVLMSKSFDYTQAPAAATAPTAAKAANAVSTMPAPTATTKGG